MVRQAPAEVVVAIRYLQVKGVSHSHLYLFTENGRLLRQLTAQKEGQDRDPCFSPDGKYIAFIRELGHGRSYRAIGTDGRNEHALSEAPSWTKLQPPSQFTYAPDVPNPARPGERVLDVGVKPGPITYLAPDGSQSLVLQDDPARADETAGYFPKTLNLRDEHTGNEQSVEEMAEVALGQTVPSKGHPIERSGGALIDWPLFCDGSPFLLNPPLRVVFGGQHRDSTNGEGRFAVDLNTKRVYELTFNWADIIPDPQKPQFWCSCEERYRELGDGKRTVNCLYLDRWDARCRFGADEPAIFRGASVWRPGAIPLILPQGEFVQ